MPAVSDANRSMREKAVVSGKSENPYRTFLNWGLLVT